eukprot:3751613-Pyramimonas_sp.AAC.1
MFAELAFAKHLFNTLYIVIYILTEFKLRVVTCRCEAFSSCSRTKLEGERSWGVFCTRSWLEAPEAVSAFIVRREAW